MLWVFFRYQLTECSSNSLRGSTGIPILQMMKLRIHMWSHDSGSQRGRAGLGLDPDSLASESKLSKSYCFEYDVLIFTHHFGWPCRHCYHSCDPFPSLSPMEMATHSSILAWRIPWTEEPGRLQSMGSQRFGHDWATSLQVMYFWGIKYK